MKCPDCGFKKKMRIDTLAKQGFACNKCSDNISYPEKFMFSVLEQLLGENFSPQLTKTIFKWCKNYRYDFYIKNISCIIETHGLQHYEECDNNWNSLKKTQDNDKNKEQLAKNNNIHNYIILDCRKSEIEWIQNSIMNSKLPYLLNFKKDDINWLKCHEYACSSRVKAACELWNNGMNNSLEIANKLKLHRNTIGKYLRMGDKLGWCDYKPDGGVNRKTLCLTTKEIFNTIAEASRKYNIDKSSIVACCRNRQKSAGKHPDTCEKMFWMYYG